MSLQKLRKRITQYRHFKLIKGTETSIHVNALEIALNLAEFAIEKNRKITQEESSWFNADWELMHVFENSEWEDLLIGYFEMKKFLIEKDLMESKD
jgi:hypothetical protein